MSPISRRPSRPMDRRVEILEDRCVPAVSFASQGPFAVNADKPQLVAVGNFNAKVDNHLDVVTANIDGSYTVLLGDGTGKFPTISERRYLNSFAGGEGIVAGDFDRDGYLDLAIAGYNIGGVRILKGDGNGKFTDFSSLDLQPGAGPTYISVANIDNDDQYLDLIVSDFNNNLVQVFRGRGDGTFYYHDYVTTNVVNPNQTAVADFDGDGLADVAVANKGNGSVSVYRGLGSGYITFAQKYSLTANDSIGVAVGDLNSDGKADLAVTSLGGAQRLAVLRNTSAPGAISFANDGGLAVGDNLINVAIGDFELTGKNMIAVSSVSDNANNDGVFLIANNSTPGGAIQLAATPVLSLLTPNRPIGLLKADVNKDGRPDLLSADEGSDSVTSFVNTTPSPVTNVPYVVTGPTPGSNSQLKTYSTPGDAISQSPLGTVAPYGASTTSAWAITGADLTGNGRNGQVVAVTREGGRPIAFVYDVTPTGQWVEREHFFMFDPSVNQSRAFVAAGDVNNNGVDEMIFSTASVGPDPGLVMILRDANGNGEFGDDLASATTFQPFGSNFSGAIRVASGNLNGVGGDELVVSTAGTGNAPTIQVYDVGVGLSPISSFAMDFGQNYKGGAFVAVGKIQGAAGFAQIIVGQGNTDRFGVGNSLVVVLQDPTNTNQFSPVGEFTRFSAFDGPTTLPGVSGPFWFGVPVAAGDADGDGFDEIVTGQTRGGNASVKIWDNNGGAFSLKSMVINDDQSGKPPGELSRGAFVGATGVDRTHVGPLALMPPSAVDALFSAEPVLSNRDRR